MLRIPLPNERKIGYTFLGQGCLNTDIPGTQIKRLYSCSCPQMTLLPAKRLGRLYGITEQNGMATFKFLYDMGSYICWNLLIGIENQINRTVRY